MKALILPCFLLFQAPSAPTSPGRTPTPATATTPNVPAAIDSNATSADEGRAPAETPAPLESWPGTVAEAFAAIEKHAQEKQFESARLIADRLLAPNAFLRWKSEQETHGGWRKSFVRAAQPTIDWLALDGLDANARGEVWFARGVIDSLAGLRPDAENDFQAARAASNDRALQNDAIYDIGVLTLAEGEEIRATLPEISGKPPTAPLPVPPAPGAAAQPAPPDPLQLARAAYLKAREHFVERLKSDWRDDDTRANVELCLKRLKELDLIEKKREEEKQKQDEQQKKDQEQKQDQKDKDQKKPDDQKNEKDPSKKDDKGDPKDDPKPEDPKPEDQKKPDEKPADEKKDPAAPDQQKDAPPVDPKDAQMSHEEMTQLLDRLKQLEDDAKKIQAQLKAARRGQVKKDW